MGANERLALDGRGDLTVWAGSATRPTAITQPVEAYALGVSDVLHIPEVRRALERSGVWPNALEHALTRGNVR